MTNSELKEAIKKSEERLENLVLEFQEALDWAEYLKEELDRVSPEFALAPNGNRIRKS